MSAKHEDLYRQLGLTIAYYRKLKHLTQLQLAERVNISRTHISNLEAPGVVTAVSLEVLFDIADALDIPVAWLFEVKKKNDGEEK